MARAIPVVRRAREYAADRALAIWDNLGENNLWKRMLKNVIATTTMVAISLIPGAKVSIGKAAYLGAITTVFGHPGRRFGQMAEALILAVGGTILGVAWATFGVYLGSLVIYESPPAAYTIRAIFLSFAVILHGYLRSRAPRLFPFVLLLVIVNVVTLTSPAKEVTPTGVTQILYPILIAAGIIILVNICIFPEFSSGYLGSKTIETLEDIVQALESAGDYFVGPQKVDDSNIIENEEENEVIKKYNSGDQSKSNQSAAARLGAGIGKFLRSRAEPGADTSDSTKKTVISISSLTASKAKLRGKVANCKGAQSECNFELAVSVLAPSDMKPISVHAMRRLAANTIAVIGACESKYALLGEENKVVSKEDESTETEDDKTSTSTATRGEPPNDTIDEEKNELDRIKPKREIEFGDARLLQYLQRRIAKPYREIQIVLNQTVGVITTCLAYAYGVSELPSGAKTPKEMVLEDLDLVMDKLQRAMARFDVDCASALESAAIIQDIQGLEPDVMPREEIFLISSFILNVRQAGSHIESMLHHAQTLVQRRQERRDKRRTYAPRIQLGSWLTTGGEEDEPMPSRGRKANRKGEMNLNEDDDDDVRSVGSSKKTLLGQHSLPDLEKNQTSETEKPQGPRRRVQKGTAEIEGENPESRSKTLKLRGQLADALEWIQESDDMLYAFKLVISLMLVLWPAFVSRWNTWYSLNRGLWAALQLVFIADVSIGTSVSVFILRAIGTTLGCLWGWAAYEARDGNRIVCAAMICIGVIPSAYVQLGTKYPKAGMVVIVSMCIVALATELETVPGTATENFLKRYIAFMIGGLVALLTQVVILPVKARTRMMEALVGALQQLIEMEKCIAFGIEQGVKFDGFDPATYEYFDEANGKANGALLAAETFLPMCSKEPRIKGSFDALALIYEEIIFVLHQITDRMDNMLQLRVSFGSGPLEELNAEIYPYRRNVAGAVTLTLFAVHGALMTKLPLPQFLPSSRLAHLRLINRIREVVLEKARQEDQDSTDEATAKLARQRATRRKYMAWNGSSAAQAEIIEFLEELVDLTKLLVGANEFNSGLLAREAYERYVGLGRGYDEDEDEDDEGGVDKEKKEKIKHIRIQDDSNLTEKPSQQQQQHSTTTTTTSSSTRRTNNISIGRRRRRTNTTTTTTTTTKDTTLAHGNNKDEIGDVDIVKDDDMDNNEDAVAPSLKRIQTRKIEAGLRRQRTDELKN